MDAPKTSLSAGEAIRELLLSDADVKARSGGNVFPLVSPSANLPYIAYRRLELSANPQKSGLPGADTVGMELLCYTERYAEGVKLAESVRAVLDHLRGAGGGLQIRGCYLSDAEENYQGDAFVQRLVFSVKI